MDRTARQPSPCPRTDATDRHAATGSSRHLNRSRGPKIPRDISERAAGASTRRADLLEVLEGRVLLSTYYVSPSGSDGAAGGSAAPWKTLQKAADTVKAGDVVHVGAGTYSSGMNLFGKSGGTASAPIQFIADSGAVITHSASSGVNASLAGINLENAGGYYVIQGFTINSDGSMQRAGIRVAGTSHVQVLNNTVDGAYIGIFTSSATDLLLQGNTCRNSTDQHGIYVGAGTTNSVIRGNICYGNYWDGIHMNASDAIGPNDGNLVEGNILHDNGLSGMDIEGVTHATFRNNVIYNNTKHGMSFHSQDQTRAGNPTPACANNTIVNNTITGNPLFGVVFQPEDMGGTVVFNNILQSASTGTYGSIGVSGSASGLTSDYNAVGDAFSTTLGTSKMSLAQWRSTTGQDAHSIVASPSQLFVNAGAANFQLKAGAPAIDVGTASLAGRAAPTTDFAGAPRPQGAAYDAGAFEYGSTSSIPDTTPPMVSGVSASNVSGSGATVTWQTDEAADTQVEYGTTTSYGSSTSVNTSLVTSHSAPLAGLSPATVYHYRVRSTDAAGNLTVSGDFTFTTAAPDTTAPVISGVASSNLTTTGATIKWTTDEAADTQVQYGLTTAYGSTTTLNANLVTSHSAALAGLTASTSYHFRVLSRDAAGNLATSGDFTFTTAAAPTTVFSSIPTLGDFTNYAPLTASRWSVAADGGDNRLYLNTTSYTELSGDRLGEYALAGSATYGDFDLTMRARTAEDLTANKLADYAVVFAFTDANNYSYVMFNADSGSNAIIAVVGGVRQTVATATRSAFTDTAYHTVQVSRRGQSVTVSVDGQQLLAATSALLAGTGRVGVGSFNDSAYFDDVNVLAAPPTVQSAAFSDATAPQTITVQFNEAVTGVLSPGAFTLTNQTTNTQIVPTDLTATYDATTRTLTLVPLTGMLPSGQYLLQVNAAAIKDVDGNAVDGNGDGVGGDNFQFAFYHLDGDANHDGVVNFDDLLIVSKNYNMVGASYGQGDLNYDSVVNFDDLLLLAKQYNQQLPVAQTITSVPALNVTTVPPVTTSVAPALSDAVVAVAPVTSDVATADVQTLAAPAPLTTTSSTTTTRTMAKRTAPVRPTPRRAHRPAPFTNRKIVL